MLNAPVMLSAAGRTRLSLADAGGEASLAAYMTLPGDHAPLAAHGLLDCAVQNLAHPDLTEICCSLQHDAACEI